MILRGDFETRSTIDLKKSGTDVYASHPSTDVWCFAYKIDDEDTQLWHPGVEMDPRFLGAVAAGATFKAYNAAFEFAIWGSIMTARYGWPPLRLGQVRCTMAQAYAMALPGRLEEVTKALGLPIEKDMQGHRLMLQMAKPRRVEPDGSIVWWDDDGRKQRLYAYCKTDVDVENEVDKRLMPLSDSEQALWLLDQTINNRGVMIDIPTVTTAIELADAEKERLDREMRKVTGGQVKTCNASVALANWLRGQGLDVDSVAKADVVEAINLAPPGTLAHQALLIRQLAAKSSTAKLEAMVNAASQDGRVRGIHQYHGAATGRWAGRRIQGQNFPRPRQGVEHPEIERMVDLIGAGKRDELDMFHGPVLEAIADSLRAMIVAKPGHDLIACDFSAIEARVVAWLAGEESVLEIFRGHGKIYEHAAAGIYRKPIKDVTRAERQIGKVAVLALGYGGGIGAFQAMARGYGINVSDSEADAIKTAWRKAHPKIVSYWYDCERAAMLAVLNPGVAAPAGPQGRRIVFKSAGSFLWCKLPSSRVLCYPYPRIKTVTTSWGAQKEALVYKCVDPITKKWGDTSTYGGSLVENVTQAVARDLLAASMDVLEARGYPIVMHVHDEVVCEVPEGFGSVEEVEELLSVPPEWATGLPMAAEGWRGKRYRK